VTTLFALGSGSRGNAFGLATDDAALLVDAGFSARELARRADACGFPLARVTAIVLTHEHGDHSAGVARLARELGTPVFTNPRTWAALGDEVPAHCLAPLEAGQAATVGPFTIRAAPTSHDAVAPMAVLVEADGGARVGFAYDLGRPTVAVRALLRAATAVVLEANHDELLLRTSGYPPSVQDRIAGAGGHLSNRAAAELLRELAHPALAAVVLAHLSERCNSEAAARKTIEPALRRARFRGTLHVARQEAPLAPISCRPRAGAQLALRL